MAAIIFLPFLKPFLKIEKLEKYHLNSNRANIYKSGIIIYNDLMQKQTHTVHSALNSICSLVILRLKFQLTMLTSFWLNQRGLEGPLMTTTNDPKFNFKQFYAFYEL